MNDGLFFNYTIMAKKFLGLWSLQELVEEGLTHEEAKKVIIKEMMERVEEIKKEEDEGLSE